MFEIDFRDGRDGQLVWGARPNYNDEYIRDYYKDIEYNARIGESLMDFASLTGNIAESNHPYIVAAGEFAEGITENSHFFVKLKEYLDLMIKDSRYSTLECFLFFLNIMGLSVPSFHHQLIQKSGHENDCVEDTIIEDESISNFEHSMKGFVVAGKEIYDVPLTVYECETVEDACSASLHFLITHKYSVRKCLNCGKYFIAYNRSDCKFCDRISPYNNKTTCASDGPTRAYRNSLKEDSLKQMISNTQTMWRMRKKRHPDDVDIQENAEYFTEKLKEKRTEFKAGKISEEDFKDWLLLSKDYRKL